jgi:hypothetical protein
VDPFPATIVNSVAYMMQSNVAVVIASNCEHRSDPAKTNNEFAQASQLSGLIDQVASQQDRVRCRLLDNANDLISKIL